ncbi:MAG TPA: hypothetical protein DGG94_16335 [Micromonosporaceae bacterium]|nr:hypothetical protein [Micromonosporaceae bacterium]
MHELLGGEVWQMATDAQSLLIQSVLPLAERCTVQILIDGMFAGSGFFVLPKQVLTCAHVVHRVTPARVQVRWDDADLDVGEMRLLPSEPGAGPTYAAPDLALLTVKVVRDHPIALCSSRGPVPLSTVLALGFVAETPAVGVGVHAMSLEVVGPSAPPLVRVKSDRILPGMSGGLVIDDSGAVCGVVKTTADGQRSAGGWIVPGNALAACLPEVMTLNALEHPPGSMWWNIATRRAEFTRRIFGSSHPLKRAEPPPNPPPSWWLDPRHQIVPFQARPELAALLEWARDNRPGTDLVKLVCGPGGVGKTRLALEVAGRLESEGWVAGLRQPDDPLGLSHVAEAISAAAERGHRVFIALDYVEGLGREISHLVSAVPPASVRILLLARHAGAWWNSFAPGGEAKHLIDTQPVDLGPFAHDSGSSLNRFSAALGEFRQRLQQRAGPVPSGLLAEAVQHRQALSLHALALVVALHEQEHGELPSGAVDWSDPLRPLVTHERKHFLLAARQLGIGGDQPAAGQALLAPTLFPARTAEQAVTALASVFKLNVCASNAAEVAELLRHLYPPPEPGMRWWAPLPLDRLSETLLIQVLTETPAIQSVTSYFSALLDSATAWQAVDSLVLLLRTRQTLTNPEPVEQATEDCIDALVRSQDYRLLGSLYVAEQRVLGENPRTSSHISGLDAADAGQLAQDLINTGRQGLLECALLLLEHGARIARDRQPDDSVTGRLITTLREVVPELGFERLDTSRADAVFQMFRAETLLELGRGVEALPLAGEAVAYLRHLVEHQASLGHLAYDEQSGPVIRFSEGLTRITISDSASDDSALLARALHVYARALEHQSLDEEGLTARHEAISMAFAAMATDPQAYKLVLEYQAGLYQRHATAGRFDYAERALHEAIDVAQAHADGHGTAVLLSELADLLDRTKRYPEAATALARAHRLRGGADLPERDPDTLLPHEVARLRRQALGLIQQGRLSEARVSIGHAIDYLRQLEADDPQTYADRLSTFLGWTVTAGLDPRPVDTLAEAVAIMRRRPGTKTPYHLDVYGLNLLMYADRLRLASRFDQSADASKEAVHVLEQLVPHDPERGVPMLAIAWEVLSDSARQLGRVGEAVIAAERAIETEESHTWKPIKRLDKLSLYRHRLCLALLEAAGLELRDGMTERAVELLRRTIAEAKRRIDLDPSESATVDIAGHLILAGVKLMEANQPGLALGPLADACDRSEEHTAERQ